MAELPASGAENTVGVAVISTADNAGLDSAKKSLAELDAEAKTVEKSTGNLNKTTASTGSSFKEFSSNAKALGTSLTTYVTLPMVGIAAASTKMAMDFQQKMEMLATNANMPQSSIRGLSDAVLKLAPQVGAGPDQLAEAFYHIASAGNGIWSTSKMLDMLKISAEGAAIGQANLDDTTYSLTSTMSSGIKGAQDASEAMATLTAIVGAGDMHFQDLNAAIGTGFLGTAATFGISLQSVGAALATLTDNGEHADAAATRMRMTWALMAAPSKQAAGLMEDLGVSASDAQAATDQMNRVFSQTGLTTTRLATDLQQPNGMNVALKDLKDHLEKAGLTSQETDAMLSKMFGGGKSDAALMTLLQNLDRTDEKFKTIQGTTTKFADKWAEQQKLEKQQFNEAWAGIQSDMVKLGTAIMPQVTQAMKDVGKAVTDVTTWYGGLSKSQKQFVTDVGIGLAVGGPVLVGFGILASAILNVTKLAQGLGGFMASAFPAEVEGGAVRSEAALGRVGASVGGVSMAGTALATLFDVVLVAAVEYWALNSIAHINAVHSALNQANSDLVQWAHDVSSTVANTYDKITGALGSHTSGFESLSKAKAQINGHATGTNYASGGWSWVGEQGPELMYVPQGSQIKTNSQSGGMGGGAGDINITFSGPVYMQNEQQANNVGRQLATQLLAARAGSF